MKDGKTMMEIVEEVFKETKENDLFV